jgi:hypothetical protein
MGDYESCGFRREGDLLVLLFESVFVPQRLILS